LITPERRRRAVAVLTERFGVSERRACSVVGQHRSTQRSCGRPLTDTEAKLRRRLRQLATTHPRMGWKTAHSVLRREGWTINRKRTQRLWRQEGLRRPQNCRKRRRIRPDSAVRHRAEYPNHVWAIDFVRHEAFLTVR
jgi:putative transposase